MTIRQVQALLDYLGYEPGIIDGMDGANTQDAVRAFQAAEGLTVDGVAGTQTQARLKEAVFQGREYKPPDKVSTGDKTSQVDGPSWWTDIRYFKRSDTYIGCSCGKCGGFPVEPEEGLMRLADKVRSATGQPMVPTSTVRCKAHNAEVGGVPDSRHMRGRAMDFYIQGLSATQTLAIVRQQPEVVYTYAINDRCVHMDIGNG